VGLVVEVIIQTALETIQLSRCI